MESIIVLIFAFIGKKHAYNLIKNAAIRSKELGSAVIDKKGTL